MRVKILSLVLQLCLLAMIVPAFMESADAASSMGTLSSRVTQNETMLEKLDASVNSKYLNKSLSEYYETDYKGLTATERTRIAELADSILSEAGNPDDVMDIARAFHNWICENFYYYRYSQNLDTVKAYQKYCDYNPITLLNMYEGEGYVIARCNGYASMFMALMRSQGVSVRFVDGHYNEEVRHNSDSSVSWGSDVSASESDIDHHWNAFYYEAESRWVTVDCTADCYNSYKNGSRVSSSISFSEPEKYNYFDPTVERLSQSHVIIALRANIALNKPYSPKLTNVKHTSTKNAGIKFSWTAPFGATSYKVYRATSKNGTYKLIKTTSSTYYIDRSSSLIKGKNYYYKVKAVNGPSTSSYSTVIYAQFKKL